MRKTKKSKTLRYSETEFDNMLKSKKIKINSQSINRISIKDDKVDTSLNNNIKTNEKKIKKTALFDKVVEAIINSTFEFNYNEDELYIIFYGAKILSLNQMLSLYQQKPNPYNMMKYKKIWHNKMSCIIKSIIIDSIENNKILPDFSLNSAKIILYRESLKLIDEDSISASFKYIIDSLREDNDILGKSYRIINDDNQFNVSEIIPYQVKSNSMSVNNIAIKIIKSKNKKIISNLNEFVLQK